MRLRRIVMPKTARAGTIVTIRALIAHPMLRGHNSATAPRPRRIVHTFTVHFGDREIFRAELFPGVAANPQFVIQTMATETGEYRFTWTEDGGKTAVETRNLDVLPQ
ncbi:MAG: thiosulfate oxidation carrier complex protein SoxZ [Hyphomicrobiaceae bacterium]|nr:thiosulfate oxidation carrier complex protein SoxZ [Hyphomicrobiaceae bacterium]